MREFVPPFILCCAMSAAAQMPPITLEWSALRLYEVAPQAHISRDPVTGNYTWAVNNNFQGASDEVAFPFLADGTDIAPIFPERFNVGSLDRLIDLSPRNGVIYNLMSHLSLGTLPYWWHLNNAPEGTGYQTVNPGVGTDPQLSDYGYDLLVTEEAAYGCGMSETMVVPQLGVARLVKTDLQCEVVWDVTWDDGPALPHKGFSGIAMVGDSVVAIALPWMVLFDGTNGSLIDTIEVTQFEGDARCIAHGSRVYWAMNLDQGLYVGYHDLGTGEEHTWSLAMTDAYGAHIVVDQYDHVWVTTTTTNGTTWTDADDQGHWYRFTEDLDPIDSGLLHYSIDDMCFVNDKISFTGNFDPSTLTAYLITGTPQP